MASGWVRQRIARELGIAEESLVVAAPHMSAPDPAQAARLAAAAAGALREESLAPITSDVQEFVAEEVGPPRAKEVVNRPRRMIAVAVGGSVFGLWCACISLISGLSQARRRLGCAAPLRSPRPIP